MTESRPERPAPTRQPFRTMLVPVKDQPGLFYDLFTGKVVNIRDMRRRAYRHDSRGRLEEHPR